MTMATLRRHAARKDLTLRKVRNADLYHVIHQPTGFVVATQPLAVVGPVIGGRAWR